MERYYQPEIETASREQITAWQNERLVKQVKHVWDNVPYYRKKMEAAGVTPEDIKSIEDLHKLPFVTKADLREAYPYGLLAEPLKNCVRIQSTSGTTGIGSICWVDVTICPPGFKYSIQRAASSSSKDTIKSASPDA